MRSYASIDFLGVGTVTNARLDTISVTAFPVSPSDGELAFLSADITNYSRGLYVYNSTLWEPVVITSVASGTALPSTPSNGALFFVTAPYSTFKKGLYYYTASNSTWNQVYLDTNTLFDISGFVSGTPANASNLMMLAVVRPFSLPANLAGSVARSTVATTASTDYVVQKNGTTVATITFGASSNIGTFSNQAAVSFALGDVLSIKSPVTSDATHANIAWTLVANLT